MWLPAEVPSMHNWNRKNILTMCVGIVSQTVYYRTVSCPQEHLRLLEREKNLRTLALAALQEAVVPPPPHPNYFYGNITKEIAIQIKRKRRKMHIVNFFKWFPSVQLIIITKKNIIFLQLHREYNENSHMNWIPCVTQGQAVIPSTWCHLNVVLEQ